MADSDFDKSMNDLDKSFDMLETSPEERAAYDERKREEEDWKRTDPVSYKKDMEDMCRAMWGDKWRIHYEAMLREEFPEDFETK
jgi:hypothetical protein